MRAIIDNEKEKIRSANILDSLNFSGRKGERKNAVVSDLARTILLARKRESTGFTGAGGHRRRAGNRKLADGRRRSSDPISLTSLLLAICRVVKPALFRL